MEGKKRISWTWTCVVDIYLYSSTPMNRQSALLKKGENINLLGIKKTREWEGDKYKTGIPMQNAPDGLLEINGLHFALGKREVTIRTPSLSCRDARVYARLAKR